MAQHYLCPAKCGKIFISEQHAIKHAGKEHPHVDPGEQLSKGWRTPYGFVDWKYPITYKQACEFMKEQFDKIGDM